MIFSNDIFQPVIGVFANKIRNAIKEETAGKYGPYALCLEGEWAICYT
jgi:hypothetical protein